MPGASNLAATTIEALDTRKIQVQVTAVARPRNQSIFHNPEPLSEDQAPWPTDLKPWIADSVSRFKLSGFSLVDVDRGYWGRLPDLDRIGSRGGA